MSQTVDIIVQPNIIEVEVTVGNGGGGSTPDATNAVKGKLKLANHLGGNADLPTVVAVANVTVGDSSSKPANTKFVADSISDKVDKVAGKSLILDSEITRLSTVTNQDISNLVVKDGTKVLSDVNFSTAKDSKLTGIATGAQVNAIDSITTTGTSGPSTLVGKVLNIPQYSGGGGGGSTDWNDITNKPIVIGAGATQSDARAAINAGTSNLTLGLTNTTAKAGDYTPSMSDVTGLNTALSNKVDKVAGKSLILDTEITRLSTVTNQDISGKQDTLVSGTNIKTINGVSVLGSGDLIVSGGGGGGAVLSVAGKTGVVTLDKNDVALGNVDNTSDVNKPISTAQSTALGLKVDKVTGKSLISDSEIIRLSTVVNQTIPVTSVAGKTGAVTLGKVDVGLDNVDNTSDSAKPVSTAQQTALGLKVDKVAGKSLILDTEITRLTGIATGATANDTDANLKNTDNHTNGIINKVFTAVLLAKINSITEIFTTALKTSYDNAVTWISTNGTNLINHLSATNNPHSVTKSQVGLSNVDNTADTAKNVLTATKLLTERNINGVAFDGTANITVTSPSNLALGTRTDTTQPITNDNGSGFTLPVATTTLAGLLSGTLKTAYDAVVTWISTNGANVLSHLSSTSNPHSVTKSQVGLSNVDNTADTAKPVSTAQQTALDLKAPLASPTFTGTVGGITKSMVGLSNVDNTSDTAKPVSTAQQTAIDAKVADNLTASTTVAPSKTAVNTALALKSNIDSPTFTGTPTLPTGTIAVKQTVRDSSTKLATTSFVAEAVRYAAVTSIAVNTTLALTHENSYLTCSGTRNITVPPNSTVAFPIGSRIDFLAVASAVITFAQGSGVTINKKTDLVLTGFGAATLVKTGTNTWDLIGNN